MMRLREMLAALVLIGLIACADTAEEAPMDEAPERDEVPAWVADVAAVANAIEARPMAVDSILEAHEMTRARLDSLLYEVAQDPVLTAAYREARDR